MVEVAPVAPDAFACTVEMTRNLLHSHLLHTHPEEVAEERRRRGLS